MSSSNFSGSNVEDESQYSAGVHTDVQIGLEIVGIGAGNKKNLAKGTKAAIVEFTPPQLLKYKHKPPPDLQDFFSDEFDLRTEGVMTSKVMNQKLNSFCWAISVAHCVEAFHNVNHRHSLEVASAQELVNTFLTSESSKDTVNDLKRVFKWIADNGLCKAKDCPWIGKISTPQISPKMKNRKASIKIQGFRCLPPDGERLNKKRLFAYIRIAPVVGVIFDTDEFQNYKKGDIYMGGTLVANQAMHAILVYGWGIDENGIPFWLIKNSHGTKWGDDGYGKMLRQCAASMNSSLFIAILVPI